MKNYYSIGETAEKLGIPQSTLRYYESEKLLDPVQRDESGRRRYTEREFRRVRFILTLRNAGVPVEEIRQYVALFHEGEHTIPVRKQILQDRLNALKEEAERLDEVIRTLQEMISNYEDTLMKQELDSRRNDPHYG